MPHFNSFADLQSWISGTWFPANPLAVQLDGQTSKVPNRKVFVTFDLVEIPNLKARVSLHGDTSVGALRGIATAAIEDFIIVPPQKKATYWRLHFKGTHNYDNDETADGLFAYLK